MGASPIPVVLFGLGAIGRELAHAAATDPHLRLVGAIDTDPSLVGRPLHRLWSPRSRSGVPIAARLDDLRRLPAGTVMVHAASSSLSTTAAQIQPALRRGLWVVSSCEELLWPWNRHPVLARRLDSQARRAGVAVLGTGVNPGFAMDVLPLVASAACRDIRRIHVTRVVDARRRRQPLQDKVGVGLTVAEFRRRARAGRIGHVGLTESAHFLATALGWRLDSLTCRLQPVLGKQTGSAGRNASTRVRGQHQTVIGRQRGREVIRLELTMAAGARPDRDEIRIEGTPPLELRIQPGTAGDEATVSTLLNGIFQVRNEEPGLVWNPSFRLPRGRIAT